MRETLCRDCDWIGPHAAAAEKRCPSCRSPRLISHPELDQLSIAHVDCDAFYASVEKRDRPELRDKPVIIGGGRRGVVATACYLARIHGVRSAMPMFKALRACPDAVVIKPEMAKYVAVSRRIREKFEALTPLVEPLSLDEAFLDLSGTERLNRAPPAVTLARLARAVENEIGVTISIGLAPNKFLAKIASDLDKPRGFHVIGQADAPAFLETLPVEAIWGVGPATAERLRAAGFSSLADLRAACPTELTRSVGALGPRLARLAWGEDDRPVEARRDAKSVSSETTFNEDIRDREALSGELWRQAERVSERLKAKALSGRVVTLKLKTAAFRTVTRRASLDAATQSADRLFRAADPLLRREATGETAYRLLGVGLSDLKTEDPGRAAAGDAATDLFDPAQGRRLEAERAVDALRARFGKEIVVKGRALK